jgi:hypothetical protein
VYDAGGGVLILEAIEPGLGESLQLSAVGRDRGIEMGGTDGICRGIEAALVCAGIGELVEDIMLVVILRSSIAFSFGAVEMPPIAATTSCSENPLSRRSARSFRFSSRTLLAALWISEDASMPICSQLRSFASSSCRYSLRRARDRPSRGVVS